MVKIKKILIANRSEIAVRIIRACKEMGITTVAIYSKVDRIAPYVLMADEAHCIGPAVAAQSYLNMEKILEVARQARVDAIHPGYGFLAENPRFARRVIKEGFIFIGPSPQTIELMGNKTASRKLMVKAGVPVVPGTRESVEDPSWAKEMVRKIGGYPIMIKAVAGGGGKGMRVVNSDRELPRALEAGKREALKAFGDASIYIERFLKAPRHIEVQILADQRGNVVHLWERDCSIQRRHQKLIEECPSVVLTPEKRQLMGDIAIRAARACQYTGVGTVEFLFDKSGNFYFLEMNTRLQVEHPVTEMVLGVDLVKLQIEIASGSPIPLKQADLDPTGHAIECRINAEDVFNQFAPSTGKIEYIKHPAGPGIRLDSGVDEHTEITMYYDPLIAKLIAFGRDRREAIARMQRALSEFTISGIQTTIPFCKFVLEHPAFLKGNFDTTFVEKYWQPMVRTDQEEMLAKVMAVAISYYQSSRQPTSLPNQRSANGPPGLSPWKLRGIKEVLS